MALDEGEFVKTVNGLEERYRVMVVGEVAAEEEEEAEEESAEVVVEDDDTNADLEEVVVVVDDGAKVDDEGEEDGDKGSAEVLVLFASAAIVEFIGTLTEVDVDG